MKIKTSRTNYEKKEKELSLSVVMATFNSERTLSRSLESVRTQNYPQEKIEIIIADGGSQDNTLTIAKQFKAKIINVPPKLQNAEYNKGIGVNAAKNEILLLLDHDNILPHKNWLKKMVQPFLENSEIV